MQNLSERRTLKKTVILFIAQGAFAGRFPVAPGTAGTVVGVLLYLLLKGLPAAWFFTACLLIAGIGTWAAQKSEVLLGKKDDQSIVIDEIAGYLVTMILVPPTWGYIVAGFVLFRVFDIAKPWPLRRLQDLHGGLGVMIDDIGAGVYANVALQITWFLIGRG